MERVLVVLVAVAMLNAAAKAQDNTTTLEEYFIEHYGVTTHELSLRVWSKFVHEVYISLRSLFDNFPAKQNMLLLSHDILQYLETVLFKIMSEFASDLGNVTLQSIYKDLNDHCGGYLETPIEDLTDEPSNVTCVILHLRKTLTLKLKMDTEVALKKLSRQSNSQRLRFCSAIHSNCTVAYEERIGKVLMNYVEDENEVDPRDESTPLEIVAIFLRNNVFRIFQPYMAAYTFMTYTAYKIYSLPSIEPFTLKNLILYNTNKELERKYLRLSTFSKTEEELSWGIVKKDAGSLSLPCSHYRDTYQKKSQMYLELLKQCNIAKVLQLNINLINCAFTDPALTPLTWSTVPSAYFHSQCLCVAYNGTECGVKAPQGVDPRPYCLSVLLRDFQRQISYRPAVTYLDYAFQTRVPVCQLVNIVQTAFTWECNDIEVNSTLPFIKSVQCFFKDRAAFKQECKETELYSILPFIKSLQCYFKDLVNKNIKCSETTPVNTYNHTELCRLHVFMAYVLCEGEGDVEVRVPFYGAGDSTLVLFLTYLDVAVRVFTLVTYVASPELRNLPGKLLIGYQATALLRLLAVRASLEDLALAVRIDVAMDLASTFWLFSYLHFLTVSLKELRPPDSLSRDEARMILLRYAMLGWALPSALSPSFFWMDEAVDSRVQYGQLLFLLCNYAALFGNLYMAFNNFHFYYHVKTNARIHQQGGKARSVFAGLFRFALKTSVLSGAGIIFRLVFTQIQGLEHLLGYYHALGTLQGLLLFILYGCNHEARAFWLRVVCSKLPQCRRRQNHCV